MRNDKKIILIFGRHEDVSVYKDSIRHFIREKGMAQKFQVISALPTEGNIAGCRNLNRLASVIVIGKIPKSDLTAIKQNCRLEVLRETEINILFKNLFKNLN